MADVNPIQVQKFLSGVNYPTNKQSLIEHARQHGASEDVISTLQQMQADEFNSPNDVSQAIGAIK